MLKIKTHPPVRDDGFYYGTVAKYRHEIIRFFSNQRLNQFDSFHRNDFLSKSGNYTMCNCDSTNYNPIKIVNDEYGIIDHPLSPQDFLIYSNYKRIKDSIHFELKCKNYFKPYNKLYACKVYWDSIVASIKAVDFDTLAFKARKPIVITYKFLKAHCDSSIKLTPNVDSEDLIDDEYDESEVLLMKL